MALSTYLVLAAKTRDLQDRILVACNVGGDTVVASARDTWSTFNAFPCPIDTDARRQRSWDEPIVTLHVKAIWEGANSEIDKARMLASKAPHSSDWLYALPITVCGLRLSDEDIRVAVGLRLGLNICEPHPCPCGAMSTSRGTHGLSCKRSSGRFTRHQQINDAIWRALKRADVPLTKEPAGLLRSDGRRPDGLTLVPGGRSVTWKSLLWTLWPALTCIRRQ